MGFNFFKIVGSILGCFLIMISCGVDDENSNNNEKASNEINSSSVINCPTSFTDQIAQGNFMGTNFISLGGTYEDHSFGGDAEYFCKIFVKSPLSNDDCAFPKFEGNRDIILFSINSLETQIIKMSNEFTSGNRGFNNTLIFNRVTEIDAHTITESSCGIVKITEYDGVTGKIYGSVVAKGINGSNIDGNFILDFCDKNIF